MKVINSTSLGFPILAVERGDPAVPARLKHLLVYKYHEIIAIKRKW